MRVRKTKTWEIMYACYVYSLCLNSFLLGFCARAFSTKSGGKTGHLSLTKSHRSKAKLMVLMKKIINVYSKCTFKVTTLLMDPEFDPMRENTDALEGPILNAKSTKEDVPEGERAIRARI